MFITDALALHDPVTLFHRFDRDASGDLDPGELARLVREVAPGLRPAEVRELFRALDLNRDGRINLDELSVWWPTPARAAVPATSTLPALGMLEARVRHEELRYLQLVTSLFFCDLPYDAPHLTSQWETVVNARLAAAERLRQALAKARHYGSRQPEEISAALTRSYNRLLDLERQERGLLGRWMQPERGGD